MAGGHLGQSIDIGRVLEQEKQAEKQQQPEQLPDGQQKTQEEPTVVTAEKNSEQPAPATDESPEVSEATTAEEPPKPVDPLEEDINAILTKSEPAKSVCQKRFSLKTLVLVPLLFILSTGILWWFISPDNPAVPYQDTPVPQTGIALAVPNYTIAEHPPAFQHNASAVGADDFSFLLAQKLKD